jgi:hypothetical protein
MGRAIDGGEKSKFERSDTIGRRSFASTGSCCRPTDLAVVPPADGQLQGIAAEMNEIPWESKGEWRLRRVWCPICVHRLTRSTRKRACAGDVHFSMRRACRKKCDADPSLTEGGRTRGSQSPLLHRYRLQWIRIQKRLRVQNLTRTRNSGFSFSAASRTVALAALCLYTTHVAVSRPVAGGTAGWCTCTTGACIAQPQGSAPQPACLLLHRTQASRTSPHSTEQPSLCQRHTTLVCERPRLRVIIAVRVIIARCRRDSSAPPSLAAARRPSARWSRRRCRRTRACRLP